MAIVYRLTKGTPLTNAEVDANFLHLDNVKTNRTLSLTAGNGLTGGGTLEANRTFTLGTPSTLTVSSTNSVTATSHNHALDLSGRSIVAGDGLSGGGTLAANRTLQVDASVVRTSRTITAGDGLNGGGNLTANRTLSVDSSVVRTSGNQTIGGIKTFTSGAGLTVKSGSGHGVTISPNSSGGTTYLTTIMPANLTANRFLYLANGNTTLVPGTMAAVTTATINMANWNGFTSGTMILKRIGDVVTISWSSFSHTSGQSASRASAIPLGFRPVGSPLWRTQAIVGFGSIGGLTNINIEANGDLTFSYRNWDGTGRNSNGGSAGSHTYVAA